jgi:hypothetical protein
VIPATVCGALAVAVCAVWGGAASASALLGAVLVIGALSTGPALMHLTRTASPPAVMASALAGYAITVLILAIVYALTASWSWLSGEHAGATVVVVTTAWLGGQLRAVRRLRILAFGGGTEGDGKPGAAAQSGSPASPLDPLH